MAIARRRLIDPTKPGIYHTWNRCVRRAFLWLFCRAHRAHIRLASSVLKNGLRANRDRAPPAMDDRPQHLCLDKGYDNPTGRATAAEEHYVPHIRRIGEEKLDEKNRKRRPARRWVVERTLGWMSKCRAIMIRYAKKSCNYLGLIQLCCGLLWYRRQYRLSLLR